MATMIYLPTSTGAAPASERASSPVGLAGLRIAVLDNGKPNAGVVMSRLAETLASAAGADVSLVTKKGPGGRSANAAIPCAPDIMQRLIDEADLVITGAADCGSCTAYSVYDAIELERLGRPTVVVTTTRFRPIAETMAANFGLADTRLLVLPHPLGGTDRVTLHRWADGSVHALTSLFTGARAIAVVDDATHRSVPRRPGGAGTDGSADTEITEPLAVPGLDDVRAIVQADGSDLELVGFDGTTLALRLRIDDASCAECVMPSTHLERVALDLLGPTMPGLQRVSIADPRR